VFCWRLALDSIPTASVLKRKNLAATPECKICGAEDDTWDHSLLHCTMSRCVWALLDEDLSELLASLRIVDPKQWLFFMCSNVPQAESTTSWLHVGPFGMLEENLFMRGLCKAPSQL
jgi:hypothetical protein